MLTDTIAMNVNDYNYHLPKELIAIKPPEIRGDARLLILNKNTGEIKHGKYKDVVNYLGPGDTVIRNDTEVIKARLKVKNQKGQDREVLLLEKHGNTDPHTREVLHRGVIRVDEKLTIGEHTLLVTRLGNNGNAWVKCSEPLLSVAKKYGSVPLPPYMHREASKSDIERYQTVFADKEGSVAAPTASLNFTKELEESLQKKGVIIEPLTLHVGMGTFLPIRTETLENHKMHSEYFVVPSTTQSAILKANNRGNRC